MGLVIKQAKTNMFDSERCVKFNCGSFIVAPEMFFSKYGKTSFVARTGQMKDNSKVVLCMPDKDGPDGYKCRMIRPREISIYNQAWAEAQAEAQADESQNPTEE